MAEPSQPSTPRRHWQGPRVRSSGRSDDRQARLRKIYLIAAVMLVLAATVAALLFYLREAPRPTIVVLRIDQYRDGRIPVSPWATQDRAALRNLGLEEKNTFTSQEKELLKQELADLGRKQPPEQPLLIYLCAYAAVRDDGTVAVLPADAKLDDPTTWLPFKEVLDSIQQSPVERRLLLLDLAIPCVEPSAGLLAANLPERLKPALEMAVKNDPNLQILTACAPGQVSLASEELGHTVFAHYIIRGLAGRADGFPNKKADTRVTVRELVGYVTVQVDRWALHNVGLRQTPEFFGNAATDYELASTEGKTAPEPAPLPGDYPPFLADGWAERDKWWNDRAGRTPPDQIAALEQTVLRADERWRKGDDAAKVENDLKAALIRLRGERSKSVPPPDLTEPPSLAEAVARGGKPPKVTDDDRRQLKRLADAWAKVRQPKPNEKPTEKEVAELPEKMKAFLKPHDGKPFELAATIFAAALKDNALRPEDVHCWYELLTPEGKPAPPYDEIRFLQRLAELPVAKPEEWPVAAGEALQLAELAAKVETLKPRTQPWLVAEYAEARKRREAAEALLFSRTPAERAQAAKPISETLQAYGDLHQHLVTLRDARRACDEALVDLPGYAAYLEHDSTRLDVWLDAVRNARALHEMLSKTPPAEQVQDRLRAVGERASTLRGGLKKLAEPVEAALKQGPISDSRPFRAADALEMRALLRLPTLTAAQRKTLWARAREGAGKLNDEFAQREATPDTLGAVDERRAVLDENGRARRRAQVSQGLLRLAGSPDVDKVEVARKRVDDAPQEETAWKALRDALREAWKRQEAVAARP
jgi:hypothetical protein